MSSHTRLSFITACLIALGCVFQVSPSMAATSIGPGIYSSAPFAFKADRGIFSAVPAQQVDSRIFSSISEPRDTHVPTFAQHRERLPHDL